MAFTQRTTFWHYVFQIFTVFLGVMLAFLVNNWKETYSNQRVQQQYWHNFLEEVSENDQQLDSTITEMEKKLSRMDQHIQLLKTGTIPGDSLQSMLEMIARLNMMTFQTATYEAIKSGGAWHLFTHQNQLLTLIKYYNMVEAAKMLQHFLTTYFNQHTIPFLQARIHFLNLKGNARILQNLEFQNIYLVNFSLRKQLLAQYKTLQALGKRILQSTATPPVEEPSHE